MMRNVAVLAYDGLAPFEFGVACEAFGLDRSEHGVPTLDFAVCGPKNTAKTSLGFEISVPHGLDRTLEADLICVTAVSSTYGVSDEVVDAIRAAYDRGARILSLCSGAFALGKAGLLDDRPCTTHWMYTERLAREFPRARVIPEVLYVDEDPIITAAGTAAGLDASLHLWRKDYGAAVASMIARRMVVPPQRAGGQAQYIRSAVPEVDADTLAPLLAWMAEHLYEDLSVDTLARRATMSARTFARRFRDEIGTTPHAWVTRQRVHRAEHLLEQTTLPVDRIADEVGFGSGAVLRQHFAKVRGVSPAEYRRSFCCVE